VASFLALYRGPSIASAELVAVSADPELIARFAGDLLERNGRAPGAEDPPREALADGRRRALQLLRDEAVETLPTGAEP